MVRRIAQKIEDFCLYRSNSSIFKFLDVFYRPFIFFGGFVSFRLTGCLHRYATVAIIGILCMLSLLIGSLFGEQEFSRLISTSDHPLIDFVPNFFFLLFPMKVGDLLIFIGQLLLLSIFLFTAFFIVYLKKAKTFFSLPVLSWFILIALGSLTALSSQNMAVMGFGFLLFDVGVFLLIARSKSFKSEFESTIKFIVLNLLGSALFFMGCALIFWKTNTLFMSDMGLFFSSEALSPKGALLSLGLILVLSGVATKLGAIPFHMWIPDLFEGEMVLTSFLILFSSSAMYFLVFLKLFLSDLSRADQILYPFILLVSSSSILLGIFLSYVQKSLKRLLAYFFIAHLGYVLFALSLVHKASLGGHAFFWLIAHLLFSLGTLSFLMWLEGEKRIDPNLDAIRGLVEKNPLICGLFSLVLLSFSGFPSTIGFSARWFLIAQLIKQNTYFPIFLMIMGSLLSLFISLSIMLRIYGSKHIDHSTQKIYPEIEPKKDRFFSYILIGTVLMIFLFGTVFAQPMLTILNNCSVG